MKRNLFTILLLICVAAIASNALGFRGPYNSAAYVGQPLSSSDSPTFVTTDLTGVTDGNIPYMQAAGAGFGDSPLSRTDANTVTLQSATGQPATLNLYADAGEDNSDKWRVVAADGGDVTLETYQSGAWVAVATWSNAGAFTSTGALAGTTLNTGQGANELYAMDQDVRTSDSPSFVTAKLSGLTDNYIPYHVADATGLADSPMMRIDASTVVVKGGTPTIGMKDTDATDLDTVFQITGNATDVTSDHEDFDVAFQGMVDGSLYTFINFDADGLLALGYGGQTTQTNALNANGILTVNPDGTNEVLQVNDGSIDFTDGNAGTTGTLTLDASGNWSYNKNITTTGHIYSQGFTHTNSAVDFLTFGFDTNLEMGEYNSVNINGINAMVAGKAGYTDHQLIAAYLTSYPKDVTDQALGVKSVVGDTTINNPSSLQACYYAENNVTGTDTGLNKWAFYNATSDNGSYPGGKVFLGGDNHKTYWGGGLDASIYWNASDLIINSENVTANDEVHFTNWDAIDLSSADLTTTGNVGIGTTDLDGTPPIGRVTIKGSTNDGSTNILVGRDSDEANVFSVDTDGNASVVGLTMSGAAIATPETVTCSSDAGTASVTKTVSCIVTDGGADTNEDTVSLANGTVGQIKIFVYQTETDAGDTANVTPATALGFTKIVFDVPGEGCTMVYTSDGWAIVSNNGGSIS